jgi:hypothetical protein
MFFFLFFGGFNLFTYFTTYVREKGGYYVGTEEREVLREDDHSCDRTSKKKLRGGLCRNIRSSTSGCDRVLIQSPL